MRQLSLSIAVVLLSWLSAACGTANPACNAGTCKAGCCDAAGLCQQGQAASACGANGTTCQTCSLIQTCLASFCVSASGGGGGSGGGGAAIGGGGGTAGGGGGSIGGGGGTVSGGGGGSTGGGGGGAGGGGSSGGGGGSVGGGGGARCDPLRPFGAPSVVAELGLGYRPWLTADERTIYFDRIVPSQNFDLFTATRTSGATFTTPAGLITVNTINADYGPSLSASGLTLYFVRSGYQAYMAIRASTGVPFPIGGPLSLGGTRSIATPRSSASGGIYYLGWTSGVRPALFVDAPPSYTPASAHTFADGLESFSVSDDERVLYFSASPTGGNRSVYRSSRTASSAPFPAGSAVPELNQLTSVRGVAVSWVSADECVLYGTAEPTAGAGEQIVRAVRPL